jgi:hypothetical protein
MPPRVHHGLRLPSRLWLKCNRLLRLGHPWGSVTFSGWGGWWYMDMKYQEGPLNLSSTKLHRTRSPYESSPSRKISHGRAGNCFFCPILLVSCILLVWNCSVIRRKTERLRAVGFFHYEKIRRLRSGANPRSWVPEASTQTPRPPKPLSNPGLHDQ